MLILIPCSPPRCILYFLVEPHYVLKGDDGNPLYSQFDDNGVPSLNAKGEEVSKVSHTVNLLNVEISVA